MKFLLLLLISLSANVLSTPEDDLRNGNKEFSGKLYKGILSTRRNENFAFSPFPVQTILATYASAAPNSNSETVQQIRAGVGLPGNNANTERAFQTILPELVKSDDDFKIFQACKLYFAHYYTVQPWFRNIAQRVYRAEIETVNFAQPAQTQNTINLWVSKQTDNKITNFIAPGDISSNTQNVIVNALYVKGKWDKPFEKVKNIRDTFYGQQRNSQIEFMVNEQSFEYFESTTAQFLKMELVRTTAENAYVVFVLPLNRNGLATVEQNIGDAFREHSYYVPKVKVVLPKFRIQNEVKLKPILEGLGVRKLFQFGAQLTGLQYGGHPYVKVTELNQKTLFEVSEWGISAESATAGQTIVDDPDDRKTFIANHPFLFQVVVDNIIVFAGRVVDL